MGHARILSSISVIIPGYLTPGARKSGCRWFPLCEWKPARRKRCEIELGTRAALRRGRRFDYAQSIFRADWHQTWWPACRNDRCPGRAPNAACFYRDGALEDSFVTAVVKNVAGRSSSFNSLGISKDHPEGSYEATSCFLDR
jgi:hypothetical protein